MVPTHLLVKVDGVAHERGVVDEVKARPVLWNVALEQQLLSQLYIHARLKRFGVPQAVDHDDYVVVELTERLAANVKGLLQNRTENEIRQKDKKVEKRKRVQLNHSPYLQSFTSDVCCADSFACHLPSLFS